MCGITGYVKNPNCNDIINEDVLDNMRDTLIHRGPDDCGSYISSDNKIGLAHRRLSIIDLSKNGRQPMSNEDNTVWITFNGEIYNYKSIKKDLISRGHSFRNNTDTEVIIHAYEEFGMKCLDLLSPIKVFFEQLVALTS